ncbi:MAG: hypothetical protein Kow0059_03690 [Candidatus Sumerlaeia bacterium]
MAKPKTEQEVEQAEQPEYLAEAEEEFDPNRSKLREELVSVKRVAKVVKGGRRFSFSALVVVGDECGHVGVGFGKANEVPSAIAKAVEAGKKRMIRVPLIGRTIPHPVVGRFGAAQVILKPASEGTGIIAGPAARAVVELAGVKDILTKSLGTSNVLNVVKATLNGLMALKSPDQVARARDKNLEDILGPRRAEAIRASLRAQPMPVAAPATPAGASPGGAPSRGDRKRRGDRRRAERVNETPAAPPAAPEPEAPAADDGAAGDETS